MTPRDYADRFSFVFAGAILGFVAAASMGHSFLARVIGVLVGAGLGRAIDRLAKQVE